MTPAAPAHCTSLCACMHIAHCILLGVVLLETRSAKEDFLDVTIFDNIPKAIVDRNELSPHNLIIRLQHQINALKCKSLASSAFLKQRSRNSEHAQISSYMYMLAHVVFSSYNVLAWFSWLLYFVVYKMRYT